MTDSIAASTTPAPTTPASTTPAPTTPASTAIATATNSAVNALLKWKESQSSTEKLQLIPDDEFVYLILTLKKIPAKPRTNAYKILLPHPLHSSPEICLIVDDRPSCNPTPETVKQVIRAENLPITKLIKLSKLRANYKPFEAKRKLCDSYDLFLTDKKVVHFLAKLLGGSFFKKKKLPVPIDMNKNWKEKVEKARSFALLYFKTGTCCVIKVGKVAMERGEIEENVREAVDRVVDFLPKKWGEVRSFHLKLSNSVALPLYQALPDMKLRIEGVRIDGVEEEKGESLKGEGVGSELKSGGKKKGKGRIHEVNYMDVGLMEDEIGGEDSDGENEVEVSDDEGKESGGDKFAGKKRKKGVVVDEVHESEDVGVKKTKKGRGIKSEAVTPMDVEKPAKKGRKTKKQEEVVKPMKVIVESEIKGNKKSPLVAKKENESEAVTPMDVEKPAKKGRKAKKPEEFVKPMEVVVESAIKDTKKSPLIANKKKENESEAVTPMDVEKPAKKGRKAKKPEEVVKPMEVVVESAIKDTKSPLIANKKKEKLGAKKVETPEVVRPKKVVKELTTGKEKKSALIAKSKEGSTEKRSKKRVKA